jgi:hypothetical protein
MQTGISEMKTALIALAAFFIAVPAMAQSGWTSSTPGGGPTTFFSGTGGNQGWNGTAMTPGGGPTTFYNFTGPNGQMRNCTSMTPGGGPTTFTNCN